MSPSSTCPGSRPTPSPAAAARGCPPRPSGRGRRPGSRSRSRGSGRCGNGPRRNSPAIPASARTLTASTPKCSSPAATASCAAAHGPRRPRWRRRRSATGTCPSAARSSAASGWQGRHDPMDPVMTSDAITVDCVFTESGERVLAEDVLDGLTRPLKELPPKHFYDARGSELFDAICELPEYYPTRTERAILTERAAEIADLTGAGELLELGSGSADKTRVLLTAMAEAGTLRRYVPIDVSETALRASAERLLHEYPGLRVHGLVGDFERHLRRLPQPARRPLVCFLGG